MTIDDDDDDDRIFSDSPFDSSKLFTGVKRKKNLYKEKKNEKLRLPLMPFLVVYDIIERSKRFKSKKKIKMRNSVRVTNIHTY